VPHLQNPEIGKNIDIKKVIMQHLFEIDGITFSGGEPLFWAEELLKLLKKLPSDLDKMLFTGFTKEELNKTQLECINYFDLVVEGRFEIEKRGNFLWRGSSNQKFISPTKKYSNILNNLYKMPSAGIEVKIENNELIYYGIPTQNDEIGKIENYLKNAGLLVEN